ncbi:MAG: type II toxin-antitoxin system HigB family toxin [Pirellulales bacterium]|nr:type II toxin-antitoxin system HigB family toxin [Pirellulales bacterium]
MRILSKAALRAFWETADGRDAEGALRTWYKNVLKADWQNFADVRRSYASADLVGDCVVFNIGGNKYRLVVKINYATHKVFIANTTKADGNRIAVASRDGNIWELVAWSAQRRRLAASLTLTCSWSTNFRSSRFTATRIWRRPKR